MYDISHTYQGRCTAQNFNFDFENENYVGLVQARDILALCRDGLYTVQHVQPFDMFPHTYHIESMAVLARSAAA
jgi:hypothetical protein